MPDKIFKFVIVGIIILLAVFFDQFTKFWAQDHLSSPRYPDHAITVIVPDDAPQALSVEAFIDKKYPKNNELDKKRILFGATRNGDRLSAADELHPGDELKLSYASITVIDGYYDYQYARNPGAAWSFLADQPAKFRSVFFGITGILAVLLLLGFIAKSNWRKQRFLIITLACILGGAVGNIIDRFRLGYVIDFISWHVGEHYWPTFNIADVFVTCGVAFLIIDLIIHRKDDDTEKKSVKASDDKTEKSDDKTEKSDDKTEKSDDKTEKSDDKTEKSDDKTEKSDDKTEKSDDKTEKSDDKKEVEITADADDAAAQHHVGEACVTQKKEQPTE